MTRVLRLAWMTLVPILTSSSALAQTPYLVSHSLGSFTAISGGTTHVPTPYGNFGAWDEGSVAIPLPFSFQWYGVVYNTVHAYTNGFVSFSAPPAGATILGPPAVVPTPGNPIHNFISGPWQDLTGGTNPAIRSLSQGAVGFRVFTVQFENLTSFSNPVSSVTFQVRLYEGTNRAEVVFGPNFGINNASTLIENATGTEGQNLMASAATCGIGCTCPPRGCSSNNWSSGFTITVQLPQGPELLGSLQAPPGGYPGTSFSPQVTVRNIGLTAAAASQYSVYLSSTNTSTAGARLLGTFNVGSLVPQASFSATPSLLIPADVAVGTYFVLLVVDSARQVAEAIEANNLVASGPFVTGPDLSLTLTPPVSTGPGEQLVVPVVLRSEGAPVVAAVSTSFYLSANETYEASDQFIGTAMITMPNGFVASSSVSLTIPPGVQPSPPSYYLLARVDPQNQVIETNETNNLGVSPSTIEVLGPELEVVSMESAAIAFRGQPYSITTEVRNSGGARALNFVTCVVLSDNALISVVTDTIIFRSAPMTFVPGQRETFLVQPPIDTQTSSGTYYLAVVADCDQMVNEANENNNVRRRANTIQIRDPAADFVALDVATSSAGAAGETLAVSARVANLGNAAGQAVVRWVLSDNAGITVDDTVIAEYPTAVALAPPNERSIAVWAQIPGNLRSGAYWVGVIVDPEDAVDEVDETNNILAIGPISVTGTDLAIVSSNPPNALIGAAYARRFAAVGGFATYAWSLAWQNGAPPGLAFDADTAELSGTPQASAAGSHPFVLTVRSGNLTATRRYTLLITPPTLPLTVVSTRLPPALKSEPYATQIVAAGGVPPHLWSADGALPVGLGVSEDGVLSGEAQIVGAANFRVRVTDATGASATGVLSIQVLDPTAAVSIVTADLPDGVVNSSYQSAMAAAGGTPPYTWRAEGAVPPGLALGGDGTFVGTPTVAGEYAMVVSVRDSGGLVDRNAYVVEIIAEGRLRITTGEADSPLPEGQVGEPYLDEIEGPVRLRAVPAEDVRWTLVGGALAPGLQLDPETGIISGTPNVAGAFAFTVLAQDPANDVRRATLALVIRDVDGATPTTPGDEGCGCNDLEAGASVAWGWLLLPLLWRRRRVLAALLLSAPMVAQAQGVPYQVYQEAAPYQPLSGATEIVPGLGDGSVASVSLPFDFYFYGQAYRTVYINANGFVTVSQQGAGFHSPPSFNPDMFPPSGFVAGLWDDWCADNFSCFGPPIAGRGVYTAIDTTPGAGKLTIEFRSTGHFSDEVTSSNVNFQIVLHEGQSSMIELHFGPIAVGTDFFGLPVELRARVGIESPNQLQGMWLGPCSGTVPCSVADAQSLTNQRITLVADAGRDLTVAGVSVAPVAYPGLPMTVSARLISRHANPIGPFRYTAHLVPAVATSTAGSPALYTSFPTSLAGFESRQETFLVEVPGQLTAGQYRVAVVVDSDDQIAETSEQNNVSFSAQALRIAERAPDFRVVSLRALSAQVRPGEMLRIVYRVENFGNEPGNLELQAVLSPNPAITTSDFVLGGLVQHPAAPRQVFTGTISAPIPMGIRTGSYYLGVLLDPNLSVVELDENNNAGRASAPVVVAAEQVEILTSALPVGTLGVAYAVAIEPAGGVGTYVLRLSSGSLPRGLSFDRDSRTLSGIPLELGEFPLEFEARSGNIVGRRTLQLQILEPQYSLTTVTRRLPDAVIGEDYAQSLLAVGGREPYVWRILSGSLPPGLSFAANGTIFGTPTTAGLAPFVASVRDDASATATVALSLETRAPGNLTVVSGALPSARLGDPYSQALFALGGVRPMTWRAITPAPPGLVINSEGLVTGVPERVGAFEFLVEVADARGTTDFNLLTLEVEPTGRFEISTNSLPVGVPAADYRALIKAEGGIKPYVWSLVRGEGTLPPGFEVRPSDGVAEGESEHDLVVTGRFEREGVWAFTVQVSDRQGLMQERVFALEARIPPEPPVMAEGGCRCARPNGVPAWLGVCALLWWSVRRNGKGVARVS